MPALLDVSLLIALLDAAHVGHATATRWLAWQIEQGWASFPVTQNGSVRIMSQPTYPGAFLAAAGVARLAEATQHASRDFSADDIGLLAPGASSGSACCGTAGLRIPLIADTHSRLIADSVPGDRGHPGWGA